MTTKQRAPIDATRAWEAAETLEAIVGPGVDLVHTKRMGWGQSITEICEVWSIDAEGPHAYAPAIVQLATHDDDSSLGEAEKPEDRLRDRLKAMLAACDKPILKFPDDFTG